MSIKRIGAVTVVAGALAFPLAACGNSSTPPALTVTATPTTVATAPSSSSCTISNGYANWEACWKAEQRQHPTATTTSPASAAPAHPKSSGIPWWAWMVIVPVVLIALAVLGFKLMEWNDEQRVRRAEARVAELDARAARRATRVLDYDDYEDDDDDDELGDEDMAFLRKATEPTPAPATPAPPAGGGSLLSSLRQQSQ